MYQLCRFLSPGGITSKLDPDPAPSLAQAPAPKLGVGIDPNRGRGRVPRLLGADTLPTQSRYRAYSAPNQVDLAVRPT